MVSESYPYTGGLCLTLGLTFSKVQALRFVPTVIQIPSFIQKNPSNMIKLIKQDKACVHNQRLFGVIHLA